MNFNSSTGEERRVRPNRHLRALCSSDCLIIEGGVELTQDEISYVDGGFSVFWAALMMDTALLVLTWGAQHL